MGPRDPDRTAGGDPLAGHQEAPSGEADRGVRRRGRGAEAARRVGVGQERKAVRGADQRLEEEASVVLVGLQGRLGDAVHRFLDFPVFRVFVAYHHFRRAARGSDREEHGRYGIVGFRFCLWDGVRVLLRAAVDDFGVDRSGLGLRDDCVRVLQVGPVGLHVLQVLDWDLDYDYSAHSRGN